MTEQTSQLRWPLFSGEISFALIKFRWAGLLISVCFLAASGFAATSLSGYIYRVNEAEKIASDLAENADGGEAETAELQRLTKLLPTTEDITRDAASQDIVHVDNSWLHEAIKKLEAADEDAYAEQLQVISERLKVLHQSLTAKYSVSAKPTASKEKLEDILKRTEYKPDEEKDSAIQAWLKKVKNKIYEWLAKLFSGSKKSDVPNSSIGAMPDIARIFLVAALGVFLVWAFVTLFKRLRQHGGNLKKTSKEKIEILGEIFEADITGDDLIKDAAEMARRGDYRMAIRRAYLAMLYEMEQRGKLRLHRAKTNNDYLRELRNDKYTYPSVEFMTNRYERVWYGLSAATMEDYSGFIENYREVAR